MITKYEAKNTIAVKHGYKNWIELKQNNDDGGIEMFIDKAMDLYAEQSNSHKHAIMRPKPDCPHCKGSGGVQTGYMEYSTCPCVQGFGEPLPREGEVT